MSKIVIIVLLGLPVLPALALAQPAAQAAVVERPPVFNTLEVAQELASGGFNSEQAVALSAALVTITEHLETRSEAAAQRVEEAAARVEMGTDLEKEMTSLSANMTVGFSDVDREIADRSFDIITWLSIVVIGAAGVVIGSVNLMLRRR